LSNRLLLLLPLITLACDDDPTTTDPMDHDHATAITFEATVAGDAVSCDTEHDLGSTAVPARLADARMFVSRLELRHADDGAWVPLTLDDTDWQHEEVALLDFEDGTGACADSGTAETNRTITGTRPHGEVDGVRFQIGIPFELNHLDSATAPAPLNAPGMFWAWQGGYKFVRVDFMPARGDVPRWNVHVGSTGCESAAPTTPPGSECSKPNRATIELDLDVDHDAIHIDLAALVQAADLESNVAKSPPGCMSSPSEPADCSQVYASLGLDFGSGDCTTDCADQVVFE
jgi:uncharacterized repeat protein (TIGR04052 family)